MVRSVTRAVRLIVLTTPANEKMERALLDARKGSPVNTAT